jgi:hypothetical protein
MEASERLNSSLKHLGAGFGGVSREVEDYIEGLQKMSGFSDEEMKASFSKMLTMTQDYEGTLKNFPLVLDLVSAGLVDFSGGASVMAKAMEGNYMQVQRLLPELKGMKDDLASMGTQAERTDAILKAIADTVGGRFIEYTGEASTKVLSLEEQLKELQEELSRKYAVPTYTLFLQTVLNILNALEKIDEITKAASWKGMGGEAFSGGKARAEQNWHDVGQNTIIDITPPKPIKLEDTAARFADKLKLEETARNKANEDATSQSAEAAKKQQTLIQEFHDWQVKNTYDTYQQLRDEEEKTLKHFEGIVGAKELIIAEYNQKLKDARQEESDAFQKPETNRGFEREITAIMPPSMPGLSQMGTAPKDRTLTTSEQLSQGYSKGLQNTIDQWGSASKEMERITDATAATMHDAYSNGFFNLLQGNIGNLKNWWQDLGASMNRVWANAMADILQQWITTMLTMKDEQEKNQIWSQVIGAVLKIGGAAAGGTDAGGAGTAGGGLGSGGGIDAGIGGGGTATARISASSNISANEINRNARRQPDINVINVVDPAMGLKYVTNDYIINVINDDIIARGHTKNTLKRYGR